MNDKKQTRGSEASSDKKPLSQLNPVQEIEKFCLTELPTYSQVFGRVYRAITLTENRNHLCIDDIIKDVAVELESHWVTRNVYPKHINNIISQLMNEFKGMKSKSNKGLLHNGYHVLFKTGEVKRQQPAYKTMCELINDKLPTLFDILGNETSRKSRVEAGNPEMTENDWNFYNSMKSGDRRWGCIGVDKEYEKQVKAEEVVRKENNRKAAKKLRLQSSSTESIVSEPLIGDNDSASSSDDDEWKPAKREFLTPARKQTLASSSCISPPSLTRSNTNAKLCSPPSLNKLQLRSPQTTPHRSMHCRVNERNFDNQVMQTYATLIGAGLSYHQASLAVATVANKIFGTNWAVPNEEVPQLPMIMLIFLICYPPIRASLST